MKLRRWLNNNSALVTILTLGVLICSLGYIIMRFVSPTRPPMVVDVYYYDLGSGRIFTAKSSQVPPIESASGRGPANNPQGVRAYVFSCGDCANESERFIGWLEMFTPEAKELMQSHAAGDALLAANPGAAGPTPMTGPGPELFELWERGRMVRTVEEDNWVSAQSPEGYTITQSMHDKCGQGVIPMPCYPGR